MALIGKIRNNLWLVIVLLGLAMLGFIFMDMTRNDGSSLFGGSPTTLAEIDGTPIDIQEFDRLARVRYSNSGADYYAQRNALWNSLVGETIINNQAEKLGVSVTEEELEGLLYGPDYSPIIRQDFPNPEFRGAVNTEQLNQIRDLEASNTLNPEFAMYWQEEKNRVKQDQVQNKINQLVSKSIYTPTWMVNMQNEDRNGQVNFSYAKIPFDIIDNTDIALEDTDYQKYIDENKGVLFNKNATQTLDYIVFDVKPTAKDSANLQEELKKLIPQFESPKDVQIFVESKQGIYNEAYFLKNELKSANADELFNAGVGTIIGPYLDGDTYKVAKILDKKVVPDSLSARHILRNATAQDPIAMQAARDTIEMIKNMILNEGFTFDSLANRFGTDATKTNGGDLGTFGPADPNGTEQRQNTMVKPFNDAVFYQAKPGELTIVESQFGVHLVEVTRQHSSGKKAVKVAYLQESIVPSKETQKNQYAKALRFATDNRTLDAMKSAAKEAGYTVSSSEALDANGFYVSELGGGESTRAMVKWANDANVGDVSPSVYRYIDPARYFENKYVVTAVANKVAAGVPTVAVAKKSIENLVMKQKKGETIVSKLPKDITDLSQVSAVFDEIEMDSTYATFNGSSRFRGEPELLGELFKLATGQTTKPVIGNDGVYIATMTSKNAAPAASNVSQLRTQISSSYRNQVRGRLVPALQDEVEIEDMRSKFF